ncbi:MAG: hypothetical protein Kow00109_15810 [Acidobacteriota bacterium]
MNTQVASQGVGETKKPLQLQLGIYVDPAVARELPYAFAAEFRVVPIRRLGRGILVATPRELDKESLHRLMNQTGKPIATLVCEIPDFEAALSEIYGLQQSRPRLGELLRADESVSESELHEALQKQEEQPKPLGRILVELGLISEQELRDVLDRQNAQNPAILPTLVVDSKLATLLPESAAHRYQVLPLLQRDSELIVAAGRTLRPDQLSELQSMVGCAVHCLAAVPEELQAALAKFYGGTRKRRLKELRLGEILIEEGLINHDQLSLALEDQKRNGGKLGEILVRRGFVSEDAVLRAVAAKLDCDFRRFSTSEIDLELSKLLPRRFAEQNQVLVIHRSPNGREVLVAMADPADLNVRDILQDILRSHGLRVRPVLASPTNIQAGIAYVYQSRDLMDAVEEMETVQPKQSEDLISTVNTPEMKRIVNQILYSAVTEGASDIHLENLENTVKVRFRIDGVLEDRVTPVSKENIANVISILKVDAGLDIAERRRSQDGVFKKRIGRDRFIDFRINVHATPFGEDAVIRILDREKNLLPLEKLGFAPETLENYLRLVENPQGLILFTGPTGSGKTTTLYSTLMYLNQGNKKIVTAEDPIEYVLDGISQYQVNEAIGNTFDDYARRFLRKDPDIILIGEIRDNKTAKACIDAAMTGHLVFSTLHTNDAVGVVRRLQNLGVDPELIADSLLLAVSQRLARRVCGRCMERYEPEPRLIKDFYPNGVPEGQTFVRGVGCEACRLKGYRGRVGLYEFWEVRPKTRSVIAQGGNEEEIREVALSEGMRVLLKDALDKVAAHQTTLEELARVVPIDQRQRYAGRV